MKLLVGPIDPAEGKNVGSEDRIALSVRRGLGIKIRCGRNRSSLSDPFPGPGRSSDGQPPGRERFSSACPYRPALFGNRAAERQAHQLLRLFAQLLALDGTQTFNLRFQSGFSFPVQRIYRRLPPATARPAGGGWRRDDRSDA